MRTNEDSGRWSVENTGGGDDPIFNGVRVELEDGLEGMSKRCWNKSDLNISQRASPLIQIFQRASPDRPICLDVQVPSTPPSFPSSISNYHSQVRI